MKPASQTQDSLDERARLEIQLATYLEIAMVATDEETLKYIKAQVGELEQKLRKMDE